MGTVNELHTMTDFDETELLERVRKLTWREFETFVASLWELQGWTTELTESSGDDGRDIIAERNLPYEVTVKIEAKRWSEDNKIGSSDIRQYALLPGDEIDHAVVVTSSSFTDPAIRTAERHDVKL